MAATFVLARVLNRHDDLDFLCAWYARHGAAFSLGRGNALRFENRDEAEAALSRARRLVPAFIDGRVIPYRVIPLP